ncbi:MAG: flagellar protein FliT [Sedimenticola sp.]|nr:flagellar protein FliT [Sedimenticola sp.]
MIKQLLIISQEMLVLAGKDEWEQVGSLQKERLQLMEKIFPLDVENMNQSETAEQIQSILDLDKQLMDLAAAQQKEIGAAIGKFNQGRQATKAYHATSRS